MKTFILLFSLIIASTTTSFAQCGKKLSLTTSKTEHLDAAGALKKTVDENVKIDIGQSDISININNDHKITGSFKVQLCEWKTPYKEGKTVLKAILSEGDGNTKNVTITIEGKDGKATLLYEAEDEPDDRVRVGVDKFEEGK